MLRETLAAAERAVAEGRPLDAFITEEFRRHREWGSRDRRLISLIVFSAVRWRGWLGTYAEIGDRVIVGAHLLETVERHPLIESLAAAVGLPPARFQPAGGLSLEERAAALARLFEYSVPAWHTLTPGWFEEKAAIPAGVAPEEHLRRCVESFQIRPPLWLRAVRISGVELAARFTEAGFPAEAHQRLSRAVRLVADRPPLPTLERRIGPCFETQDLASQCVIAVAAPSAGERWWDVCAGAGGKALALAEATGAPVLATDPRERALAKCAQRARRIGGLDIETRVHDATHPLSGEMAFDGVLVDAPCSGIGMWSRRPDARWQTTAEWVEGCAALQHRILRTAASLVRPGGRLVYSVCTMARAETLDVADAFTAAQPDFTPEPLEHPLGSSAAEWPIWVWPWMGPCGGMFIARWRRRNPAGE